MFDVGSTSFWQVAVDLVKILQIGLAFFSARSPQPTRRARLAQAHEFGLQLPNWQTRLHVVASSSDLLIDLRLIEPHQQVALFYDLPMFDPFGEP